MALQSSGKLTLNEIAAEFGGTAPHGLKEYYDAASGIPASGTISILDFYGASSVVDVEQAVTTTTINGQTAAQELTVSNIISSGGSLNIPSTLWVWSDSISTPALLVDIPCTIYNYGKIIGKGGAGSSTYQGTSGEDGGSAIKVTSSGVTIYNYSGAYIAGGGGGGSGGGGGGGAGGGAGGGDHVGGGGYGVQPGGAGGAINASGADGTPAGGSGTQYGRGGGAGGGGGGYRNDSIYDGGGGGGGGRILPGTGGSSGYDSGTYHNYAGGAGGSGGNAGGTGPRLEYSTGGGGWGAASGDGFNHGYNGSGGAAIEKTTSYTLSNSGTVYGST